MNRGFTLIEMLVVLAIVTILGSLLLAGLSAAKKKANINQVEIIIKGLEAALERYEADFNDYPPSDGDTTGMTGAENLYECLRTSAKSGDYLPKSNDYRSVENPKTGKSMFCDVWNRPIVYLHHHDYGNKSPNKHTFRLASAGPNGEFENVNVPGAADSDDIVNWNKAKPGD
jgi:prepilin-type N-terminal cleavage/methylation domain-containing protein